MHRRTDLRSVTPTVTRPRYNGSCARMLVAVAPASPPTTSLPRTKNSANEAAKMMIKYKTPAILALRRGEASRIRSIITPVFVVVSPSGTPSELPVTRLQPMDFDCNFVDRQPGSLLAGLEPGARDCAMKLRSTDNRHHLRQPRAGTA